MADTAQTAETDPALDARRRRVRRRQTVVFVAIFLVVVGIGIGAAGVNLGWWQGPFDAGDAEPADTAAAPCPSATTTPVDPAGVQVAVLNATARSGLAAAVGDELGARGVTVGGVDNAPDGTEVLESAQILHGPEGAGSARGLASIVPGAVLVEDAARGGPQVDLVLGEGWTELAPPGVPLTSTTQPATIPQGCPSPAPDAPAAPSS